MLVALGVGVGACSSTEEAGPTTRPDPVTTVAETVETTTTTEPPPTTAETTTTSTSSTTTTTTTTTIPGQLPTVEAAAYAVWDTRRNVYLDQSAADTPVPVGPLMKLLTAQTAYDAGQTTKVIVAPDSGLIAGDGEISIGIRPGQELARDLVTRAMLKAGADDAARMLALDIAGSEAAFAEMMNATAAAMGLTATRAVNATGADAEGQTSSANDLTSLAARLMGRATFQLTVIDETAELNGLAFDNPNRELLETYPGADGVFAGSSPGSGWSIVASASHDGRRLIATVIGAPSEEAARNAATGLLDWAFLQP